MTTKRAEIPDLQGDSSATAMHEGDSVPAPPSSTHRTRVGSESKSLLHDAVHRLQMYAPPIESVRTVLDDFQDFIQQGNMIDLAIGLILGKAFTDILNSFVLDILSPIISLFSGNSPTRLQALRCWLRCK